jgi:hypothetical protein
VRRTTVIRLRPCGRCHRRRRLIVIIRVVVAVIIFSQSLANTLNAVPACYKIKVLLFGQKRNIAILYYLEINFHCLELKYSIILSQGDSESVLNIKIHIFPQK